MISWIFTLRVLRSDLIPDVRLGKFPTEGNPPPELSAAAISKTCDRTKKYQPLSLVQLIPEVILSSGFVSLSEDRSRVPHGTLLNFLVYHSLAWVSYVYTRTSQPSRFSTS